MKRNNWNTFKITLFDTIKRIFSSWICISMIIAFIVMDLILIIIFPKIAYIKTDSDDTYNNLQSWLPMIISIPWGILPVFITIFASASSDRNELTLIFSRPVDRNMYLLGKLTAQIYIGLLLWIWYLLSCVILRYMALERPPLNDSEFNNLDIISCGISWGSFLLPMLMLIILSVVVGNLYGLFMKHNISVLFVLLIAFIGIVALIFIVTTTRATKGDSASTEHLYNQIAVATYKLPTALFGGAAALFGIGGLITINKINIKI